MDFELTDEQRAFAQAARDYAQGELAPHAARWDAEGIFPREAFARAGELGFCAIYASEEIGGLGLPRLDATLVFEEMAAVDPSTTAFLTIHNMATWMVGQWARPAVREQWGPLLASGEKLASYCLTEPNAGSDAGSLATRAERQGDDYVLNGAKAFISGGGDTDLLVVMARTGGDGPGGVSAFAVPADAAGIAYGRKEEKMGWNSQSTRPITFEQVRVPASHMLGEPGEGFKIAMKGLDGGRINIGTCSVGAAQGAMDAARRYMDERRQFNRKLAQFQALQFKLADMATHLVRRARWCGWPPASWTPARPTPAPIAPWPSASPPTWVSRSAWTRSRSMADMGICATIRSSAWCAILACTRSWRARTRSCGSSSPDNCLKKEPISDECARAV